MFHSGFLDLDDIVEVCLLFRSIHVSSRGLLPQRQAVDRCMQAVMILVLAPAH